MALDAQRLLDRAKRFIAIEGHLQCRDFEQKMAFALCEEMRRAGIQSRCIPVAPKRWNVESVLQGEPGGRTLIFNTHLDTVPGYGMEDAFTPRVQDGRLYGRGAADVRGALACLCESMIALKQAGEPRKGRVVFLATCDEESGSLGARAALRDLKADGAVVCEPTDLRLGLAHKGVEWFRADFAGVATHSGRPENGVNAIYGAARFINALREYEQTVLVHRQHPLTGPSTLNVGVVQGGSKATVVPDACSVELDRRWIPGETRAGVCEELEQLLRASAQEGIGSCPGLKCLLGDETNEFSAMVTPQNTPLLQAAKEAHHQIFGVQDWFAAVPFWTEAALFQTLAGIPAVVFGPGCAQQAHSGQEYVEIAQLEQAAAFCTRAAEQFCKSV